MLLTMLADGRLHLTAIAKLAPHLTRENRDGLLERATHRSKRQIEEQIAEIAPRPDVPVMVRKLPERRTLPTAGLLVVPSRGEGLGLVPIPELRPDGVATPVLEAGHAPPRAHNAYLAECDYGREAMARHRRRRRGDAPAASG